MKNLPKLEAEAFEEESKREKSALDDMYEKELLEDTNALQSNSAHYSELFRMIGETEKGLGELWDESFVKLVEKATKKKHEHIDTVEVDKFN